MVKLGKSELLVDNVYIHVYKQVAYLDGVYFKDM